MTVSIPTRGHCTCPSTVPTARAHHLPDCPVANGADRQWWAKAMLSSPTTAAVEMSGMADADLTNLRKEFG